MVSLGVFFVHDADRLLSALVRAGIEPQIEVDDGIRRVSMRFGSAGMKARVEVFVPPASVARACTIRDHDLKLTGEV